MAKNTPLLSPLRYPGSKRRLVGYIRQALQINDLEPSLYVEPFVGGASVALQLMQDGLVEKAILVDLDPWIASFWQTVFYDSEWLVEQVQTMDVTLDKWHEFKQSNWRNKPTVRESFRAFLDRQFYGPRTRFNEAAPTTSLRSTLFYLASRRPGKLGTGDPGKLKIFRCPQCGEGPIEVEDVPEQQHCSFCGSEVHPTDCLRLWEEVQEYQSNRAVMSRVMMILEHLIPFHYIRFLFKTAPLLLSGMAFFVDGPLAIFGTAAWLHRSFMIFLQEVNRKLSRHNCLPLLVIGLQKTGQIVDHVSLIDRFVSNDRLFAIDDAYRYKYILAGREASRSGFGFETYYGQDFIYKTPTSRTFVLALPYPYASKEEPGTDFIAEKVEFGRYAQLPTAIKLINMLESDLYQNAVVPIALAHRYTAISLQPGGKVLDLLTRKALQA